MPSLITKQIEKTRASDIPAWATLCGRREFECSLQPHCRACPGTEPPAG